MVLDYHFYTNLIPMLMVKWFKLSLVHRPVSCPLFYCRMYDMNMCNFYTISIVMPTVKSQKQLCSLWQIQCVHYAEFVMAISLCSLWMESEVLNQSKCGHSAVSKFLYLSMYFLPTFTQCSNPIIHWIFVFLIIEQFLFFQFSMLGHFDLICGGLIFCPYFCAIISFTYLSSIYWIF